jgi:hypothetical protein
MPITSTHAEYSANTERWRRNRAACAGQDEVKQETTLFLPDDSATDLTAEARNRYARYLMRAVWLPVSSYTKQGLLGMVFRAPPKTELPSQLEYMLENADGSGLSLEQCAKIYTGEAIEVGRCGILAEYPESEPGLSAEQVAARNLQARLTTYRAESIDNWKFELIGGILKLTMVKLCELTEIEKDEFLYENETRYRVLRLRDGVYTQAVYDDSGDVITEEFAPTDFSGSTFDHIPFHFIGSETNRPDVDKAVISGIVDLNTAHYQLSADSMKNLHIHSGGLLHIDSGETSATEWKEVNKNGITVGADQGVITQGGGITLVQLAPADAVEVKLKALEGNMLSVGAHLITERGDNETAEAARIDASSKASALLTAADNVSEAVEAALEDAARFMGGDPEVVEFELNRSFYPDSMDATQIMAGIQLVDRGVISINDLRDKLRASGMIDNGRTNEDLDNEAQEVEPLAPVVAAPVVTE